MTRNMALRLAAKRRAIKEWRKANPILTPAGGDWYPGQIMWMSPNLSTPPAATKFIAKAFRRDFDKMQEWANAR